MRRPIAYSARKESEMAMSIRGKSPQMAPKGVGNTRQGPAGPTGPGPAKSADMSGALMGKPTDSNPLRGAIKHLGASKAPGPQLGKGKC